MQSAIQALFPPRCLSCGVQTHSDFGLCGACWRETRFISGLACDVCCLPLPGENLGDPVLCDTCLATPYPWKRGRAALVYEGTARKLILGLKYGDRQDLVGPLAGWMASCARDLVETKTIVTPVPLHRQRLFRRKFNQAALLGRHVARKLGVGYCPDLLVRTRNTVAHENMTREERVQNQFEAYVARPSRQRTIRDAPVLLVDDVLTSGATLAACSESLMRANARSVNILVLARVAGNT
ncbi:MAG: double zinc ribbon domain-containing protein [Paracoccaceae bacterium]